MFRNICFLCCLLFAVCCYLSISWDSFVSLEISGRICNMRIFNLYLAKAEHNTIQHDLFLIVLDSRKDEWLVEYGGEGLRHKGP